jgi:hypothetical protein
VVVELAGTAGSPGWAYTRFDSTVIEPGGGWERPKLRGSSSWPSSFNVNPPAGGLRIYAGQADPANSAHFTFDYEYAGRRGTIDGWLQADETVLLEYRGSHPQRLRF